MPNPDITETNRNGQTDCQTCPLYKSQPARTLAALVLRILSDTIPAGFTSDDEKRAKELARLVLDGKNG